MACIVLFDYIPQREKSEHASEMTELQEKLKKDMLVFQEKLQHVQQQTMLTKAENLAKEAEVGCTRLYTTFIFRMFNFIFCPHFVH